ncbi:hypothetical protein LTR08_004738 [Meristemomyces frigidus]|nr:hypothetical protein LTR08_004738 [Meristemomyces frigidus]
MVGLMYGDSGDAGDGITQSQEHHDVSDSEWEYEYDQNENEDHYFTVDLTTHVPAADMMKQRPDNSTAERTARDKHHIPGQDTQIKSLTAGEPATAKEAGQLQFLDLHTPHPYVKYNDGIYHCDWTTELGTQVYISQPGRTEQPLRPGHVLDVVGMSQVRLLGKPVTLRRHDEPSPGKDHGAAVANAEMVDNEASDEGDPASAPNDFSTLRPGQPLVIPRNRVKNKVMSDQASFLERLSAVKLKKGENDIIPVSGVRFYDLPSNRDEIRAKAYEAEGEPGRIVKRRQKRPKPTGTPQRVKRTYAQMGKETKKEKKLRLKQVSERPIAAPSASAGAPSASAAAPSDFAAAPFATATPAVAANPLALLLPRSQTSITATPNAWNGPVAPPQSSSTVQYDMPSWSDPSAVYHSGGYEGALYHQPEEPPENYSTFVGQSTVPSGLAGTAHQIDGDSMEVSYDNGDASAGPTDGDE